jgi:large subunit ribosomal protein L13
MRTISAKATDIKREWLVFDAEGQTLGRMSSRIAAVLRGKHKPTYTPHVDTGDFVVIINAEKVKLSGNKLAAKMYYHHSGFFGGIKGISAENLLEKRPEDLIRIAVKGMLPKNPLGRKMFKKLKVYAGEEHPHTAQNPQALTL